MARRIKVQGVPFAYDESSLEDALRRTARDFDLILEVSNPAGPGGWPEVDIIGTPAAILKAFTTEGAWSTGDEEDDAEALFDIFSEAKPLFG